MACLVPNLNHGTKKNNNTTRVKQESNKILLQGRNKNRTRLLEEMYTKLMLNILKVIRNSTFIYTNWAFSLRKFFKNFQPTSGPCVPMCKLIVG
jgi:hypothetical protein